MTRFSAATLIVAVLYITPACSLWPTQPPAPQLHDFGPLPVLKDEAVTALTEVSATAPSWLENNSIHYRLLYNDPTALRSYADHRWAAPPADLLATRVQNLLTAATMDNNGSHGSYVLSIDLIEFEQDFNSAHTAQVRLELQITLRPTGKDQIIAQRRIMMTQSTSANVQGAISGLARLADQVSEDIATWARTNMNK